MSDEKAADTTPSVSQVLDDDSKRRVLLEERFRLEVQRQLAQDTKKSSALWTFVNSAFALWLLTAVFITGIGSVYTYWTQHSERVIADAAAVQKLDLEIAYRFYQILVLLQKNEVRYRRVDFARELEMKIDKPRSDIQVSFYGGQPKDPRQEFLELLRHQARFLSQQADAQPRPVDLLVLPPTGRYPSLFPEYAPFSLPSLIALLRDHLDSHDQPAIDTVLRRFAGNLVKDGDGEVGVAILIKRDLVLPRWRQASQVFFKCAPNDPLCVDYRSMSVPRDVIGIEVALRDNYFAMRRSTAYDMPLYILGDR